MLNSNMDELFLNFVQDVIQNTRDVEERHNTSIELLEKSCEDQIIKTKQKLLSKINIGYVLHRFPTLSETFVINEIKWLKKNGYNVKVFCYGNPDKLVELDFPLDIIRFDFSKDAEYNLEKLLIEHKIGLLHTHFVYPACTIYTHPVAEKLKIPFTVFAHAYDIFVDENDKRNNLTSIANSEYCKAIFTLSEYHKNFLLKRGVPEEKIVLTQQATEYTIQDLKKSNNNHKKKIVSISRFVEKKGLDDLIKTAEILKNENYEFSMYGFGKLGSELKNEIKKLGLNNISVKDPLNGYPEVSRVIMGSDLLISPCKIAKNGDRDGFPTIILESMALGTPVLTTYVSAIPEIITDLENGFLVSPENPEELAQKIKLIFKLSSDDLLKIRENAQNDVVMIANIDKTMNTLLSTWIK